jgi:hypothetical protein
VSLIADYELVVELGTGVQQLCLTSAISWDERLSKRKYAPLSISASLDSRAFEESRS